VKKSAKILIIGVSAVLHFIALSSVCMACPGFGHSPEVPEELLKKKN